MANFCFAPNSPLRPGLIPHDLWAHHGFAAMNTIALLLRSLAIGVLTVLITFPSRAESAGVDVRQLGQDIMIVDEIRPDMKGYGLTVFRGAEIEKFRVEVV